MDRKILGYSNPNSFFPAPLITYVDNTEYVEAIYPSGESSRLENFEAIKKQLRQFLPEQRDLSFSREQLSYAVSKDVVITGNAAEIAEELQALLTRNGITSGQQELIRSFLQTLPSQNTGIQKSLIDLLTQHLKSRESEVKRLQELSELSLANLCVPNQATDFEAETLVPIRLASAEMQKVESQIVEAIEIHSYGELLHFFEEHPLFQNIDMNRLNTKAVYKAFNCLEEHCRPDVRVIIVERHLKHSDGTAERIIFQQRLSKNFKTFYRKNIPENHDSRRQLITCKALDPTFPASPLFRLFRLTLSRVLHFYAHRRSVPAESWSD